MTHGTYATDTVWLGSQALHTSKREMQILSMRWEAMTTVTWPNHACRYAHTQPMMDLLLAPESFLLSERYASAVKTLGLAIFFMPVLPLSCVIALAGQHHHLSPHSPC